MKKYLVTLGGQEIFYTRHVEEGNYRDYMAEAERLISTAYPHFDEAEIYTHDFLTSSQFYPRYASVLDKVSFGFAFKPMILADMLRRINYGDIVFFADSNHVVGKNPEPFFQMALENNMFVRDHIWIFYPNKEWTRRDVFINMNCDDPDYWNSQQMQCNVTGYCKTDFTIDFVNEWKKYSLDPKTMFGENKHKNFPEFREHRHEQSIYSILVKKYNIPYLNRTENVWNEYIIPEWGYIAPKEIPNLSQRKEIDRLDNK